MSDPTLSTPRGLNEAFGRLVFPENGFDKGEIRFDNAFGGLNEAFGRLVFPENGSDESEIRFDNAFVELHIGVVEVDNAFGELNEAFGQVVFRSARFRKAKTGEKAVVFLRMKPSWRAKKGVECRFLRSSNQFSEKTR